MNRLSVYCVAWSLIAAASVAVASEAELKRFQGHWQVIELVEDGKVIPPSATFAAVGLTAPTQTFVLPVLYVNQDRKVSTADVVSILAGLANVNIPAFEVARAFGDAVIGGDSGNPIFAMLGDELVLLGGWYTGADGDAIGKFPWLITHRGAIEAIMGQKLRVADMSNLDRIA